MKGDKNSARNNCVNKQKNVRLCLLQLLREWNSERVSASRRVAYVDRAR
jgi:hypothetical protein